MNEIEIKQKIRDELSWNGFDEEVIEPLFQIVNTAFLAGQKQERERYIKLIQAAYTEDRGIKEGLNYALSLLSATEPKS